MGKLYRRDEARRKMKVTDSLITFDGDVFLNRSSILKLGLPEDDADAIYNDLFGQSFVSDGATAYIFLDTNLRIRNNRSLFIKHSIIEKTKYSFSDFDSIIDFEKALNLISPSPTCGTPNSFSQLISYAFQISSP